MGRVNQRGPREQPVFTATLPGVAPGEDATVTAEESSAGAIEVHTVAASGPVELVKEVDTNGDGTYNVSVTVDTQSSAFHSQGNQIEVSKGDNTRLKITNTGSSELSAHLTGIEVPDR